MQAYRDQTSAMIDLIEGKPLNIGKSEDGRAAVEACVAIMESSSTRSWISL